jgi:hypothetical protein
MNFIKVWLTGYINPARFAKALRGKPAPHWGLYAQILRGLMDSLLLYLPISLMGRIPPTSSYLTFIPTGTYYGTLVWLTPFVFLAQFIIGAGVIHVYPRLQNQPGDIDQILNIAWQAWSSEFSDRNFRLLRTSGYPACLRDGLRFRIPSMSA